ncbi:cation:dicarboxylase symporter family transporter [Modestobacter sp. I12A-02628]|uniref:Cation:dicarboxylase symporter family transporter n=1 Tax=Goekera deserti TaxID=2497753 RepID=A0A7K3WJB1_9ACTN|nr:cation:dicarboxylase symporter family transporter [Goekera deserti]MPR00560.1 cation:dicarboxylase symporter family transporter [Goekera deserti]NDI50496.1 cation:dicarboxylase symporter family transporter [Goekera deserti]NEL56591.1 cation:dicarboxylase symporter family transporter [Goekera deserti]
MATGTSSSPPTPPSGGSPGAPASGEPVREKRDKTHWLYIAVIVAVVLGIAVGLLFKDFAVDLKWLGTMFVNLIKMLISPVIFCTIVLGIGSIRTAAKVGRVGGLALGYFLTMSTFALAIGLVVGNLVHPGDGLQLTESAREAGQQYATQAEGGGEGGTTGFILGLIPRTLVSALTEGSVLQTLLVALLVGFAIQSMGKAGEPILRGIGHLQRLVFKILAMIMWVAPIGAFGAIAAVVGETGVEALKSLGLLMAAFYLTCAIFVFGILGAILKVVARVSIFKLCKYLGREYLLIVSSSSSETALPRLIAKMEHAGVSRPVAGIVVPTGYSFNLDGTAIYLTMASLFIAEALGDPLSVGEQIGLLVFMIIASKGAAGVSGAGLATLAGGLSSHRPELLDGVGLIVGIDRFMSEARAVTNFSGNAVAAILVATWTKELDREQLDAVLAGQRPFDEATMVDGGHGGGHDVVEEVAPVAADRVTTERMPAGRPTA